MGKTSGFVSDRQPNLIGYDEVCSKPWSRNVLRMHWKSSRASKALIRGGIETDSTHHGSAFGLVSD